MAAVYFLAYKGKSPLSRLIRFFTAGDYSHIGLAVARTGTKETHGFEIWRPQMGPRPFWELGPWGNWYKPWEARLRAIPIDREHKPGTQVDLYKLPCTGQEARKIFWFYLERIGAPYDFLGALTCITSPTREDKKRWFCSEIAYAACLSAGAKLLNEERPAKVTPRIFCLSPYLKFEKTFYTERA